MTEKPRFIVDQNAGKLTKLLRLMGFDAVFFDGKDDAEMLAVALAEKRVVLTRDTGIMQRGIVTGGRVQAILIQSDEAEFQIRQVVDSLDLSRQSMPFTRCLECNGMLEPGDKAAMEHRVPPYVFKTQEQFVECPDCRRIYWKGTHWQSMMERLARIKQKEE